MEQTRKKKSGTPAGIQEALKKATTEMLVLYLLREKPMYTYEMMHAIEERSDGTITFNTMYQAIYRLQDFQYIREHGKIVSEDNRTRVYFAITEEGEAYLEVLKGEYLRFTNTVDHILGLEREAH